MSFFVNSLYNSTCIFISIVFRFTKFYEACILICYNRHFTNFSRWWFRRWSLTWAII